MHLLWYDSESKLSIFFKLKEEQDETIYSLPSSPYSLITPKAKKLQNIQMIKDS